jgi:hypothetical protein
MKDRFYTLSVWKVRSNEEVEFKAAWRDLAKKFSELPNPPIRGTLLQSLEDPLLFYSFGPWESLDAIQTMLQDPESILEIDRITNLCQKVTMGAFHLVDEIES